VDYFWGTEDTKREARLAATPFKTKNRSCTDVICLVLFIVFLCGWVLVAIIAFRDGDPEKVLYPTDSSGNICGRGEYAEKPFMMMFDISRCAGIGKAIEGCPTPSICVENCPDIEWSYKDGKIPEVRSFCQKMSESDFESRSIEELVSLRLCPAYLVQQKPLFDRCLPSFGLLGDSDTATTDSSGGNTTELITGEVNTNDTALAGDDDTEQYREYNMSSYHDGTHKNYTIEFVSKSDEDKTEFDIVAIHGVIKKKYKEKEKDDRVIIGEHGVKLSEEIGSGSEGQANMASPSAYDLYDATGSLSDVVVKKINQDVKNIQDVNLGHVFTESVDILSPYQDGIDESKWNLNRNQIPDTPNYDGGTQNKLLDEIKPFADAGPKRKLTIEEMHKAINEYILEGHTVNVTGLSVSEIYKKHLENDLARQAAERSPSGFGVIKQRNRRYLAQDVKEVKEKEPNIFNIEQDINNKEFSDDSNDNRSLYYMLDNPGDTNISDMFWDRNNSKRDLTDIDLDTLKEGVDQLKKILNLRSLGERLLWDLSIYWWMLLVFLLFAFVLSFSWVGLLSCCAMPTVWMSIIGSTIGLSAGVGIYSFTRFDHLNQQTEIKDDIFLTDMERISSAFTSNKHFWLTLCIAFSSLSVVLMVILCFCSKRILIATEMISEASHAVRDIAGCLLFPLLPFLLHLILVIWFLIVGSFLLSSRIQQFHVINGCEEENCTRTDGEPFESWDSCAPDEFLNCTSCPEAACVFNKYGPQTLHLVLQWYNIFALLWSIAFVSAFGDMTIAGAVAQWYWTFKKPSDLPSNILGKSLQRTTKYHLGTIACGSFILAVVQLLRFLVEYINDKVNKAHSNNKILKGIIWFFRGIFFFLEKLIKYLNRNAFIMTAMVGSGFCKASKEAFAMVTANVVRGFFVNQVTDFVMLLGKVFVIGVTTLSFALVLGDSDEELHFNIVPILLIVFGSYHIANSCFSVYTVAVDTLFLCFLKDIETNDGGWRKPYYMSKRFMKIMKYENI